MTNPKDELVDWLNVATSTTNDEIFEEAMVNAYIVANKAASGGAFGQYGIEQHERIMSLQKEAYEVVGQTPPPIEEVSFQPAKDGFEFIKKCHSFTKEMYPYVYPTSRFYRKLPGMNVREFVQLCADGNFGMVVWVHGILDTVGTLSSMFYAAQTPHPMWSAEVNYANRATAERMLEVIQNLASLVLSRIALVEQIKVFSLRLKLEALESHQKHFDAMYALFDAMTKANSQKLAQAGAPVVDRLVVDTLSRLAAAIQNWSNYHKQKIESA